ncbi:hypothetical protein GOODEAATRI_012480, partial [Goodea atripinnis]
ATSSREPPFRGRAATLRDASTVFREAGGCEGEAAAAWESGEDLEDDGISVRASNSEFQSLETLGVGMRTYARCWQRFSEWCRHRGVDPVSCSLHNILSYLQGLLDAGGGSINPEGAPGYYFSQPR